MAEEKKTALSIILRAVDQATGPVRALSAKVAKLTAPAPAMAAKLGGLAETGISKLMSAFEAVGGVVKGLIGQIPVLGGVIGGVVVGAAAGLIHLVNQFDELGKKAKRLGVSADFLAQMRDAAERTGVPLEALDSGLEAFNTNLGQARANTGRMAKFLGIVSPALLHQLKAAKGNAEAFDILANAMTKLQDPAKRAALAQKTLGDPALAELFMRGAAGIKEMRDHYAQLAGPQDDAVKASEEAHEAMLDLKDSTDGVKTALVVGLAPALKVIAARMSAWLSGHREDIKQWAIEIGEKLPGAIQKVVEWLGHAIEKLSGFFEFLGKIYEKVHALMNYKELHEWREMHDQRFDFYKKAIDPEGRSDTEMRSVIELKMAYEDQMRERIKAQSEGIDWTKVGDAKYGDPAGRTSVYSEKELLAIARGMGPGQTSMGADTMMLINQALASGRVQADGSYGSTAAGAGAPEAAAPASAKITIDLNGAPPGTRVRTDPSSTADVDLNVGYNLLMGAL